MITNEEEEENLPMPVYSLLTPIVSLYFLNHIMLSFGRYVTELDLSLHGSIRENSGTQNSLEWMTMRNIYRYIQMNCVKDESMKQSVSIPLQWMFYNIKLLSQEVYLIVWF